MHKALDFIEQKLKFLPISGPPMSGQPIGKFIAPHQKAIIRAAFNSDGTPNKSLVLCWSRKWGKSMISSWILSFLLETKEGWRGLTAASTFSQSAHIFDLVAAQIKFNLNLESKYKVSRERIVNLTKDNHLSRIYSEASSNLGNIGIKTLVFDQIESAKDRANFDSIQTGMLMGNQKPQVIINCNVPVTQSHWSTGFVEIKRKDKEFKFFEYAADMEKDWATEEAKQEANPFYPLYKKSPEKYKHLKVFVANVDKQEAEAKKNSEEAISYRRYILGQRISQSDYQWIRSEDLRIMPLDKVLKWKNSRCVIGLDLSLTIDFSAAAVCWFSEDDRGVERVAVHPILHVANNLSWRRKNQQRQFREWANSGHIVIQERKALNPRQFLDDMDSFILKNKIYVSQFVWDRGLATAQLVEQYPRSTLVHSTAYQVSAGIRYLEGRAKEGQLFLTSKNPCALWMHDSAICSAKSKGYTLLTKANHRAGIDLCQSEILATKWQLENPEMGYTYMSG